MQDFGDKKGGTALAEERVDSLLPDAESLSLGTISMPHTHTEYGSPLAANQNDVLYGSSPRDVSHAAQWLTQSPENVVVRITGGCLLMDQEDVEAVQNMVEQALDGYEGILISGDSIAVNSENPQERRPCMPEVGPRVAASNENARHLGVFPGESLELHDGYIEIGKDFVDGVLWEMRAHENPGRRMAVKEAAESFWAAERQQVYEEIIPAIEKERTADVIAVIGFDGGPETWQEYMQVAEMMEKDPRVHLFLIEGGGEKRATDSLIRDEAFLKSHPNIHVVQKDPNDLKGQLTQYGAI